MKRISWHIYGATGYWFSSLFSSSSLSPSLSLYLSLRGLPVVPESRPYHQRAGGSIRRRCKHLFSAALGPSVLNEASWGCKWEGRKKKRKEKRPGCVAARVRQQTLARWGSRLHPLRTIHWPVFTCRMRSSVFISLFIIYLFLALCLSLPLSLSFCLRVVFVYSPTYQINLPSQLFAVWNTYCSGSKLRRSKVPLQLLAQDYFCAVELLVDIFLYLGCVSYLYFPTKQNKTKKTKVEYLVMSFWVL